MIKSVFSRRTGTVFILREVGSSYREDVSLVRDDSFAHRSSRGLTKLLSRDVVTAAFCKRMTYRESRKEMFTAQ